MYTASCRQPLHGGFRAPSHQLDSVALSQARLLFRQRLAPDSGQAVIVNRVNDDALPLLVRICMVEDKQRWRRECARLQRLPLRQAGRGAAGRGQQAWRGSGVCWKISVPAVSLPADRVTSGVCSTQLLTCASTRPGRGMRCSRVGVSGTHRTQAAAAALPETYDALSTAAVGQQVRTSLHEAC